MSADQPILHVYEAGELTVVGFGGIEIIQEISVAPIHSEILALVEEQGCKQLAFDLTGVKLMPSGLLGVLASLRKKGVEVHVYNPSDDVRDVFATTKLDTLVKLHDVEL